MKNAGMYKDLIVLLDESTSIKVNDNVTSSPFHDIALFLDREQQHSGVTVAFTYAFISREEILTHKKLKTDRLRDANFNCERLPISLAVDYEDAESWQGSSSAVDA